MAVKKVKLPNNTTLDINDARVVSDGITYIGDTISSATYESEGIVVDLSDYQPLLVSGTNIKTINNQSLLGSGNIGISGGGGGGEENVIETVKVNGTALTPDANKAVDITVPTETTVTNWGFTKNAGTVTGVKMNGTTNNPTSGVVDLGTVITSETSLSKGTTSGNGNAVTDISVSGHQITLTKGSTFLTSETSLSKGTTTGSGNAVTDLSVSGHQITLTMGTTFLTSHQDISGKENTSNKVTSLSSQSTDTQYPSAKCVYDLVGNIETLLAAI